MPWKFLRPVHLIYNAFFLQNFDQHENREIGIQYSIVLRLHFINALN